MSYKVIDPKKIKAVRGNRSLSQIVEQAKRQFDRSSLSAWENGHWLPKPVNIPALLQGLGCSYDDIASPFEEIQGR